jgi:glycosyltransferase involved in cell wall biosynthesis
MLLQSNQQPFVIPNVVDASTFRLEDDRDTSSLRETLGILPEESVLGFCGELRHKKGLPFLLDALTEVRACRPACLLIIGDVRPREASQLNTFALEHPESASRILISGNLESPEDVVDHFHLCDVILQPSVWDGLPNALIEAMACGKIVIASDAGGIPEVVEHGKDGFLIPKALLNQLGTAVIEVLNLDPSEKKKISTAARKKVVDFYNHQTEATNLLNLLTYLMNESTSKSSNSL